MIDSDLLRNKLVIKVMNCSGHLILRSAFSNGTKPTESNVQTMFWNNNYNSLRFSHAFSIRLLIMWSGSQVEFPVRPAKFSPCKILCILHILLRHFVRILTMIFLVHSNKIISHVLPRSYCHSLSFRMDKSVIVFILLV